MELLDEAKVGLCGGSAGLDVLDGLCGSVASLCDQVSTDDGRAATDALYAMNEHASIGVTKGIGEETGGTGKLVGELGEGKVFEVALLVLDVEDVERDGDVASHGGEDVGDAETGERGGVLGEGEVGHVEVVADFRDAGGAEGKGGRDAGDGRGGVGGGAGCGGDGETGGTGLGETVSKEAGSHGGQDDSSGAA